jgi:hypothetical protein
MKQIRLKDRIIKVSNCFSCPLRCGPLYERCYITGLNIRFPQTFENCRLKDYKEKSLGADDNESCFMCVWWRMRPYCWTGLCEEESQYGTTKAPHQHCEQFIRRSYRYPMRTEF